MRNKLPKFLDGVMVTAGDMVKLQDTLGNWLKVHARIKNLKPNEDSLDYLRKLMVVEYKRKGGPRMDIVTRLFGRYKNLRNEVERVEL